MKQNTSDKLCFLTPHSSRHTLLLTDVLSGDFSTVCERLLLVIRSEEDYPKTYFIFHCISSLLTLMKMILNPCPSFMLLSRMPDLQKPFEKLKDYVDLLPKWV